MIRAVVSCFVERESQHFNVIQSHVLSQSMTIEKGLISLKTCLQALAYLLYKHITEASAEVTVSCTDVLSWLVTRQRLKPMEPILILFVKVNQHPPLAVWVQLLTRPTTA